MVWTLPCTVCDNSAEDAPSFRGCGADLLAIFPTSGDTVPVGCTVCIREGSRVTLDCLATTATQDITYEWTGPGGIITRSQLITVSMQGSYRCRASNLDFPNTTIVSVLVCKFIAKSKAGADPFKVTGWCYSSRACYSYRA